MFIVAHGWSHKNLTKITLEEAAVEIEKNDSIISANLGFVPRTFCYPYNARNEEVLEIASKNRVDTRTKQIAVGGHSTPEKLDQWINELLNTGEWGVGMKLSICFSIPPRFCQQRVMSDADLYPLATSRSVS